MTPSQAAPALVARRPARVGAIPSHWIPSFTDLFFVAMVVWLYCTGLGWKTLVLDADTGWHIRTGEYILATGSVPRVDIFSYSKPNQPWFAWEWLTDVLYALIHAKYGLAGLAVLSGLMICLLATVLLRQMIRNSANPFIAIALTLVGVGASSVHFHARPHLFTMLFLAGFAWVLARDRGQNTRWVWLLAPLTALWTNLHGGFLVGVALICLLSAGLVIESLVNRLSFRQPVRYGILAGACALASLANPYGFHLHLHVISYLRADFIRNMVQEFESPRFRSEQMLHYELLLLAGLMAAGSYLLRRKFPEALWLLFFAHMSLASVRHVPLFVIVAMPLIAAELTRLWEQVVDSQPRRSTLGVLHALSRDVGLGFRKLTVWCPAIVGLILLATPAHLFPLDFPADSFPVKMLAAHRETIEGSPRLFTTDQWGDYLIYHLYPKQKVFFDGRSDFYGEQHCKEVIAISNLNFRWQQLVEKHSFDVMLLPSKFPLASGLKMSPEWRLVADDGQAVLFCRRSPQ